MSCNRRLPGKSSWPTPIDCWECHYSANQKINEAVTEFQQSVDLLTEIKKLDNQEDFRGDLSRVLNSLAIGQKAIGQTDEAVENYLTSIDYARRAVSEQPDNVELRCQMATTALNLGNLMSSRKEYQAAREYYELSFLTFSKLANDFPSVGRYLKLASLASTGLGVAHRRTSQPDKPHPVFGSRSTCYLNWNVILG